LAADAGMAILLPRSRCHNDHVQSGDRFIDQDGQLGEGRSGDAAVFHAGLAYGLIHPAKEILRTSSRLRITLLTSALSVAATRQRCHLDSSPRPATTTQFAETSRGTSYVCTELGGVCCLGRWSDEAFQPSSAIASLTVEPRVRMVQCWLPVQRSDDVHQGGS
jgi:hypothetical protein